MNRELKKTLVEMYFNAETDVEQERMLTLWFATHGFDEDEETAARLLLAEYPETICAEAEKEYDSILASRQKKTRLKRWAYGFAGCAALAAGVTLLFTQRADCGFNGMEVAWGIERIMSLDMENVESVTARPEGHNIVITATMNDGDRCSYLMSKDRGTSAISITAMND